MKGFVRLRARKISYLKDNNYEDKNSKGTKKCVMKRKLKFQDYKTCLIILKINHLEKSKIDEDSLEEFIKNNKPILEVKLDVDLEIRIRFKSEKHNLFTEKIKKITLSSIDDKRIQSIESKETYAYGMNKNLFF